ncbi:hypothetical protein Tco_1264557 [Tanacetum coccineum]
MSYCSTAVVVLGVIRVEGFEVPGVNTSTEASGSKPRGNTKKNRIPPAKTENKKKVEVHPRTNKSGNQKGKLSDKQFKQDQEICNQRQTSITEEDALGKLNCGYQWRPTGKKFALGELCPLTKLSVVQIILRYLDSSCSKLDLEEEMNGSSVQASVFIVKRRLSKQFKPRILKCQQRRLLASLQAPFLKEKKGVRFSALYLQKKRNLFVLDHSHQQVSYFVHARSVVMWINVDQLIGKGKPSLDLRRFYSFQVNEHWLTLSADLLQKALNVTPADSAHPFESPPAVNRHNIHNERVSFKLLMKMKFNRLLNLIWMIMSTIYNKRWIIASQDETIGPSVHPEDATSTKMVCETLSHADAESGGNSEKINSETDTEILNFGDEQDALLSSHYCHPTSASSSLLKGFCAGPTIEDTSITQADLHPSVNPVAGEPSFAQSTSGDLDDMVMFLKDKARLVSKEISSRGGYDTRICNIYQMDYQNSFRMCIFKKKSLSVTLRILKTRIILRTFNVFRRLFMAKSRHQGMMANMRIQIRGRSTSGSAQSLEIELVSWSSKKQKKHGHPTT